MSRYTGPKLKKMRAVGMELPGLSRKSIERKPNPPGMKDGQFRRKKSDYKTQLLEKHYLLLFNLYFSFSELIFWVNL